MYDHDKRLYLVKRFNGKLEYFKRPQDLCSMPKIDLRSINNIVFINLSNNTQDELFAKFLKDQCDKDFPLMKTAKGRRFVSKYILDPFKKEPWIYFKYPPPKIEKEVPVHSRDDMTILHKSPIRTYGGYDQEAKPFTRVVALAMAQKIYAGSEITSLNEVIVSWFDRKKDWTPSPPINRDSWFKEMGSDIQELSKKPWIYYRYPPPRVVQEVPVPQQVPDNSLAKFLSWYLDEMNLAAMILRNADDTEDIDMILDPMDLLKFGKEDMMKLHQSPIRVYSGNDALAKSFTRVVAYAIDKKLYAGAGPHSVSLQIG
ncbi:hypothetical protein R6Q57_001899 [Mikania cordata]